MSKGLVIERSAPGLEPVGDGWTVWGRAVPYGIEQRVTDDGGQTFYVEEFAPAAFARDILRGGGWINLFVGHHGDFGDRHLGACTYLEERDDGLYPTFALKREHPLAAEARAGELTNWSVKATVYRSQIVTRAGRQIMRRLKAGCEHVAATPSPQYAGAGVLIARDHEMVGPEPKPLLDRWRGKYPPR